MVRGLTGRDWSLFRGRALSHFGLDVLAPSTRLGGRLDAPGWFWFHRVVPFGETSGYFCSFSVGGFSRLKKVMDSATCTAGRSIAGGWIVTRGDESSREVLHGGQRYPVDGYPVEGSIPRIRAKR